MILTTRQRHWPTKFLMLPIDVMTDGESIKTIETLIQRNITTMTDSLLFCRWWNLAHP